MVGSNSELCLSSGFSLNVLYNLKLITVRNQEIVKLKSLQTVAGTDIDGGWIEGNWMQVGKFNG